MAKVTSSHLYLLESLKAAIDREELTFVLQPKFDTSLNIGGVELLARWNSVAYGNVSPEIFIPLAEAYGLATRIGKLAIRYAAHCASVLAQQGRFIPISVNMSAIQVMEPGLVKTLKQICKEFNISTCQLELELTETAFLHASSAVKHRMKSLIMAGFLVALDDFGSGYSSLGYLRKFAFHTVKIDREFLIDLGRDPRSQIVLAWVVGLCKTLGVRVVVEGVETRRQLRLLQQYNVDQYQGFFLSSPVTLDQLMSDQSFSWG